MLHSIAMGPARVYLEKSRSPGQFTPSSPGHHHNQKNSAGISRQEDTGRWSLVLASGVSGVRSHFRDLIQLPNVSLAVNKLIAARISRTVPRLQHSHAGGIGRRYVHLGVSTIGAFRRDHLDKLDHLPVAPDNFVDARIVIHRA